MATNRVDELFDIAAIDAQKAKIAAMLNDIKTNLDDLQKLGKSIQIGGSVSGSASNIDAANQAMIEFTKNLNSYNAAVKSASAARVTSMKLSDEEAMKSKVNQTALNKELKEQVQLASNLTSAYDKLNLAHKQAVKEYQNAAASAKLSATEITALKDRANDLGQQLFKIDTAVGNYRRNVGNYSSTWNGLGNAINQISREMPNFAQSFQLGILAISNNLPILADEIKRAKDNIAELKAEGKSAPSLFSQIAASVFSWQTALTIGITLLVKYGAEIADWVMQVSDAEKMTRKYQEALKDSISTESSGIAKLYALKAALADTTNSRQADLQVFNEAKKEFPQYFDYLNTEKATLEQINAVINEQIAARIQNAKVAAYQKVQTEAIDELVKAEMKLNEQFSLGERFLAGWAYSWKVTMNEIDFNKLSEESKKYILEQEKLYKVGKISVDVYRAAWVRAVEYTKAQEAGTIATKNYTNAIQNQNIALNSSYDNSIKKLQTQVLLAKSGSKEELKAKENLIREKLKMDKEELLQRYKNQQTNLEYIIEFNYLESQAQKELDATRESYSKKNKVKIKKEKQEVSKDTIDIMTQISREIDLIGAEELANREKRLEDLRGLLEADVISVATYEKQKQVIIKNSEAEILRLQTERLGAILNEIGLSEQNTQKVIQMFYDKSIDLSKKQTDAEEAELKERERIRRNFDKNNFDSLKEKEALEKRLAREKEQYKRQIAQETANFIFTLLDAQAQKEVESLEKQKEVISERYELERQAIDAAFLADEEKAARKKVLDAEEAERQKQIDAEIRQIKRKAAMLEKVQALATIAINTAVALANAKNLALFGALSPLIIGLGAAQAAAVIATPIPEYAKGKKESDSYEGLAIAGEKGAELMIDKEGKLSLLTKPTLINTRRGDRIYSNQELRQGVANERIAEAQVYDNTEVVRALGYGFGSLNSTIKNKKPDTIILDQTRYYDLQRAARR